MQIVQLGFADNLLLFCRVDHGSVQLLHECFEQFSKSSGLTVNKSKCSLLSGGDLWGGGVKHRRYRKAY